MKKYYLIESQTPFQELSLCGGTNIREHAVSDGNSYYNIYSKL